MDRALFEEILVGAEEAARMEPLLADHLESVVLRAASLGEAAANILASKLSHEALRASAVRDLVGEALSDRPGVVEAVARDLRAICDRDPACRSAHLPLLYYKGLHALLVHRIAYWLWSNSRRELAAHLQNRCSELFGVDIHPAARIGAGIFIDHATSVVIGETAVVEDDVSMLHEVTLGGTGKETGDRHPKVGHGVLICAGAKVLGNVSVGEGAKIAAGSVVLDPVPPHCTVAGVPAVVVGHPKVDQPALEMDASLSGSSGGG